MEQDPVADAKELFLDALELVPAERTGFVDRRTAGRPALRERVLELLVAHAESAPLFDRIESRGLAPTAPAQELPFGARLGPYSIERVLGVGGFGTVYLATQTEPVERRVALKVLRSGLHSDASRARFVAESQVLARMEHPGIALVFDAGSAPGGELYFAMEYVPGEPCTEFCDRHGLDLDGRLRLFESVCQAVAHAHQRGVVHRDLKPTNVLVLEIDGEPRAKVIDFGVAKAIDGPLAQRAVQSLAGELVGTPAYMSPEQISGELDLDTRADVYALGALLYELACGEPPFDAQRLGFAALFRAIEQQEPELPSRRQRSSGDTTLRRRLPADVDWIALRCLEKDRERRYPSASALAADVRRFLDRRPVEAAPPSTWYRICKLARRHRLSTVAAALVFSSLVAGAVGVTFGFLEARTERDLATDARLEAERQRDVAQSVLRFLDRDLLSAARPGIGEGRGPDVRLMEVVEVAASRLERGETVSEVDDDPLVLAPVQSMVAEIYEALGEHRRALEHVDAALAQYALAELGQDPAALRAASFRATVLRSLGRYDEALEQARSVLAAQSQQLGEQHADTLESQLVLASTMGRAGLYVAAREKVEGLASMLDSLPSVPPDLRERVYSQLGISAASNEDFESAERYFRLALEVAREQYSADDPNVLLAVANLGAVLMNSAQYEVSIELFEEALRGLLGPLGARARAVLAIRRNLADARLRLGRIDEAQEDLEALLADSEAALGTQHVETGSVRAKLAECSLARGDLGEAERLLRRAYEGSLASAGPDARETQARRANLMDLLYERDREHELSGELHELSAEDVASRRRTVGPAHVSTVRALANQAMFLERSGEVARAEAIYLSTLDSAKRALGSTHAEVQALAGGLVDLLRKLGRLEEAEQRARQSLEAFQSPGSESKSAIEEGRAHARLGFVLLELERFADATDELELAHADLEPAVGAEDVWVRYIDQLLDEMPDVANAREGQD